MSKKPIFYINNIIFITKNGSKAQIDDSIPTSCLLAVSLRF